MAAAQMNRDRAMQVTQCKKDCVSFCNLTKRHTLLFRRYVGKLLTLSSLNLVELV
jgi:hypothetical protein